MSYLACDAHTFPHQHCPDCGVKRGSLLTGIERTELEKLRERMTDEDRPDPYDFASELDADGMVKFRPATVSDHLDWVISRWLFSDGPERAIGEVE